MEVSAGGGGTAFITNLENLRPGPGLAVGLAIHGDWVIGVETRADWTLPRRGTEAGWPTT